MWYFDRYEQLLGINIAFVVNLLQFDMKSEHADLNADLENDSLLLLFLLFSDTSETLVLHGRIKTLISKSTDWENPLHASIYEYITRYPKDI